MVKQLLNIFSKNNNLHLDLINPKREEEEMKDEEEEENTWRWFWIRDCWRIICWSWLIGVFDEEKKNLKIKKKKRNERNNPTKIDK